MKKNLLLLFLMVPPFFVSSCSDEDGEGTSITTDWLTAKSEGNILTITIQPTTLDANRFMKVEVEAGDVFDEFNFKQRGLKGE